MPMGLGRGVVLTLTPHPNLLPGRPGRRGTDFRGMPRLTPMTLTPAISRRERVAHQQLSRDAYGVRPHLGRRCEALGYGFLESHSCFHRRSIDRKTQECNSHSDIE